MEASGLFQGRFPEETHCESPSEEDQDTRQGCSQTGRQKVKRDQRIQARYNPGFFYPLHPTLFAAVVVCKHGYPRSQP